MGPFSKNIFFRLAKEYTRDQQLCATCDVAEAPTLPQVFGLNAAARKFEQKHKSTKW